MVDYLYHRVLPSSLFFLIPLDCIQSRLPPVGGEAACGCLVRFLVSLGSLQSSSTLRNITLTKVLLRTSWVEMYDNDANVLRLVLIARRRYK